MSKPKYNFICQVCNKPFKATYNRIRKEMIKKGLVEELGDRFSPWYSIETTAYAMVNGYKGEWGPVKRGECY